MTHNPSRGATGLPLNRRQVLRRAGGLAAALSAPALAPLLLNSATAAGDDYKALVCLFLYGGNDGMNMVTPRDATRHAQYSAVRGPLALPRSALVPLDADHGLHPALSALSTAWTDGALAPVLNVGPLHAPLSKAQYLAASGGGPLVPDSLFSHSDQQVLWSSGGGNALARQGWGGSASRALATVNPPISFGGNAHFTLSDLVSPWVLPGPGADFGAYGFDSWAPVAARRAALNAIMQQGQATPLAEAFARQNREAFNMEGRLRPLIAEPPNATSDPSGIGQAFAPMIADGYLTSDVAAQLMQVARFVHGRATVLGSRQVFFVQMGGFDNHADQVGGSPLEGQHAGLMKELGDALAAFWQALKTIGMADKVTLFTESDFGRTFAPNESNGTDHAWGNHQLLLGGAVKGRAVYGRYPTLVLGGPDDVGVEAWELQGRWIPGLGVDQYASTLLRWWGLPEAQIDTVLPGLKNFGSARDLGFMKV